MSTILFVEDSPICREPLAAMLRFKGYQTICAGNGREALAEMNRHVPDLVLLDVAMPEMDGLTFLRVLRGKPQWRDVPVMLLTAAADRDCVLAARDLGISGCLLKSHFSLEELLGRVRKCLGEQAAPAGAGGGGAAAGSREAAGGSATACANAAAAAQRAAGVPDAGGASPGDAPSRPGAAARGVPAADARPAVRPLKRAETLRRLDDCVRARTLAGVVAEVIAMASSPRCAIADLADVLKKDPVLAARVIQVANTAAFATQKLRVSTVEEAVRNIGAGTVARIAATVGIFETFPPDASDGFNVVRCWQHSFAVAAIMERLLSEEEDNAAGRAYLAGLCHDLGEIVVRQVLAEEYAAVLKMATATGQPPWRVEPAVLGIPHVELTALVLNRLGLPDNVVGPICEYHEQMCGQSGNPSQAARCLHLADGYAHGMLLASTPQAAVFPVLVSECRSATGRDEPPAIGDRELRTEVLTTTSLLARLSPEHANRVCKPLLPSRPLRVWYARHKALSPLDPLAAAVRMLARAETFDRLPASPQEAAGYDVIVAAAPRDGLAGFSAAEIAALIGAAGRDNLRGLLLTCLDAPAPAVGPATALRAPVSLERLAGAISGGDATDADAD